MQGIMAMFGPVLHAARHVRGVNKFGVGADGQSPCFERPVGLMLRSGGEALAVAEAVADHSQFSTADLLDVLLPQASGGCVARVCKGAALWVFLGGRFFDTRCIHVGKISHADKDLTAHLKDLRNGEVLGAVQLVRQVSDGFRVDRDIFTHASITPSGCALKHTIAVDDVEGQPVDFQLAQVLLRGCTSKPLPQFGLVKHIVKAEHPLEVLNVVKGGLLRYRCTDLLGGAVGNSKLGVVTLELLQFAEQCVEISVGD